MANCPAWSSEPQKILAALHQQYLSCTQARTAWDSACTWRACPARARPQRCMRSSARCAPRSEANESAPFRYIEINALRLATPQHAYVQLYRVSQNHMLNNIRVLQD